MKVLGRKAHLIDFEEKLRCCTAKCEAKPSRENMKELDFSQADCNKQLDYCTLLDGLLYVLELTGYEKGDKNNKYFFNFEKFKKSFVRKSY